MPSRDYLHILLDIRDNALLAQAWTAPHTCVTFTEDTKTFDAVTRCPEIVSEASRGLPQALRCRHAHLPWRAIMDSGNAYRHQYDNIDRDLVWDTVKQDLPAVLEVAEAEIARFAGMPPADGTDVTKRI